MEHAGSPSRPTSLRQPYCAPAKARLKRHAKSALTLLRIELHRLSIEERDLRRGFDPGRPPPAADLGYLVPSNPELLRLERLYRQLGSPVSSTWASALASGTNDLRFFRGDNLYLWQYTRSAVVNRYRYFIYGRHVLDDDEFGLLGGPLSEDGAFGCFTFEYPGMPLLSRDLLDSVRELTFLGRHTDIFRRHGHQILDIGAGYGRLAHRTLSACSTVEHYWCIDAIPRSTFLSRYYLRFRGLEDRAHVLDLDQRARLVPGQISLAVNVHSFSEMPYAAIEDWLDWLCDLDVPAILVVPNEGDRVLSREPDGSRRDSRDAFSSRGYRVSVSEPVIGDLPTRAVLDVEDRLVLFERGR